MSAHIKDDLIRWGIWHRQGNVARHLWYPSKSVGADMIKVRSGYDKESRTFIQALSDDEVRKLDRIVLTLKKVDKTRCLALTRKYIDRETVRDIARELKLSRTKAHSVIQSAEAWVEGALIMRSH
ncbi:antiterminator Q family protein [Pleionea sediminis]|uniref:antiterminator Q family protein n=1 Tax=Pleionea sediminis TaxID=2569479 RepID=UPI001185A1ED|nr:antiterminator Q family protein [Pleionea sediminis]